MCYWILTKSGKVIAEMNVQHVTCENLLDSNIATQVEEFNDAVTDRLYDENCKLPGVGDFTFDYDEYDLPQWDPAYGDNTPDNNKYGPEMDTVPLKDAEDLKPDVFDK